MTIPVRQKPYSAILLIIFAMITGPAMNIVQGQGRESRISSSLPFLDVQAFAQDSLGYMWIATIDGLNRYNGYEYELFMNDVSDSTSLTNNFVFSLLIDSDGDLLVGTARGICRFDFEKNNFQRFSGEVNPIYTLYEDRQSRIWAATPSGPGLVNKQKRVIEYKYRTAKVNVFKEDYRGRLWMGTSENESLAVLHGDVWEPVSLPGNASVNCIYSDPQGKWWLGTNEGILFFDPDTHSAASVSKDCPILTELGKLKISFIKEIEPLKLLIGTTTDGLYHLDLLTGKLSHNVPAKYNPNNSAQLHTCYIDRQGNVWVGTYEKGLVLAGTQSDYFNQHETLSKDFAGMFVTRVLEAADGSLWIATRYNGLYRYTEEDGAQKILIPDLGSKEPEFLECFYIDSRKRIWIAYETFMVQAMIGENGRLSNAKVISMDNIRKICENGNGDILLGRWSGLYRLRSEPQGLEAKQLFNGNVTDICILNNGDVVFSAYGIGLFRMDSSNGVISPMKFNGSEAMTAANCVTLMMDSSSRLWLGSYGYGLTCIDGEEKTSLTRKNGLPSNNILCFQEDVDGNIWASSSHGIVRIRNDKDGFLISNCGHNSQQGNNQYHEKCGCITHNGQVFFGGNHGLTFFKPHDFDRAKTAPVINLEDLKIFNKSVEPSSEKGAVLQKSITLQKEIVLNHTQRSISIDYSGIDFFSSSNLSYKYRLLGYEQQWNMVGTYRRASYSNLRRGEYEFQVTAINDDGMESLRPATLKIKVKPAPWNSGAAWFFYILLLALLTYYLMKSIISTKLSNERAEIERKEKEREKEMTNMKITFFTNISHEFRTVLALITGPLERINQETEISSEGRVMLNMMTRNAKRMIQLINQLMDFTKIENGVFTLEVSRIDIIPRVQEIFDSFNYLAERKSIDYSINTDKEHLDVLVDADKLEKILNNLISNALKHTPQGGKVSLVMQTEERAQALSEFGDDIGESKSFLRFSVEDNGEGVPEEKMNELFVRYRHIESIFGSRPDYSSNGIGLHYTKNLVEKHKGRITAIRKPEGGMIFSFILPLDDVYSEREKNDSRDSSAYNMVVHDYKPLATTTHKEQEKRASILVTEDNIELRDFITSLLSSEYNVLAAGNGIEALNALEKHPIDLVLSDIIMPEMDGRELCREIKSQHRLCHIPVVLLTAKATMSEQIEGLDVGANAYICKPFNTNYLLLVIKNLLGITESIRNRFLVPNTEAYSEKIPSETINEKDCKFMEGLTSYIEKNLSDPEFDVDMLADEMCVSRSALYRRIKSLTGLSPNDCVKHYRMKRAAELVTSGERLTDVSERCGFSSYSYFSKAFKKHFGTSPTDYLKTRKK